CARPVRRGRAACSPIPPVAEQEMNRSTPDRFDSRDRRKRILVTGGAGFIGAALVRRLVRGGAEVLNVDALTYAGDSRRVAECEGAPNYSFLNADIADADAMRRAVAD